MDYQGKLYSLFHGKAMINGKEYGERGTIDGIPYRPINEALAGPNGDGNGCISGYNCRHRAIEYEKGSRPPKDFSKAEMEREYAIDKQQRSYENRIRQLKQEEKQLRACGMEKEASAKRKQWRRLTKDYQIYSIEHDRAYYPYRYVIDRSEEIETKGLTNKENYDTLQMLEIKTIEETKITELKIKYDEKQFGKKIGKHAQDFNLDPTSEKDRQQMKFIIDEIVYNASEIRSGTWRGQSSEVVFYIKGEDVVITKQDTTFITILKGGVNNARVKNARKQ